MASEKFTLVKGGGHLQVDEAGWELQAQLMETVRAVKRRLGLADADDISEIITTPEIRLAIVGTDIGRHALYENVAVTPELFNDKKLGKQAMADYIEMLASIVKVNCNPFFLKNSLSSKTPS